MASPASVKPFLSFPDKPKNQVKLRVLLSENSSTTEVLTPDLISLDWLTGLNALPPPIKGSKSNSACALAIFSPLYF